MNTLADGVPAALVTLRDYFAAHAMAAILARLPLVKSPNSAPMQALDKVQVASEDERLALRAYAARGAYLLADAMLEARKL